MTDQYASENESHDLEAEEQNHTADEHYDDQPPVDDFADPDHSEGTATVEETTEAEAPLETNVIDTGKKKSSGSVLVIAAAAIIVLVGALVYFQFFGGSVSSSTKLVQIPKPAPAPQLVATEVMPTKAPPPVKPDNMPAIVRDAPVVVHHDLDIQDLKTSSRSTPTVVVGVPNTPNGVAAPSTPVNDSSLVSPSAAGTLVSPAGSASSSTGSSSAPTSATPATTPSTPTVVATVPPTPNVPTPAAAPAATTAATPVAAAPPAVVTAQVSPSPIMASPVIATANSASSTVNPSSAVDSRLTALSVRVGELQKSLDQATAQLSHINATMASIQQMPPTPAVAKTSPAVEDRLAKIEQSLVKLQNETQAIPSAGVVVAAGPTPDVSLGAGMNTAPKKAVTSKHAQHLGHKTKTVALKPKTAAKSSQVWVLRAATPDEAWVATSASSDELRHIKVGDDLPGVGQITAITQSGDNWEVKGSKGVIH